MNPQIHHDVTAPVRIPGTAFEVSAFTDIGGRRTQEDRFTICPSLGATTNCGFGLFDGTAGDFAAENVKRLVFGHLVRSKGWNDFEALRRNSNEGTNRSNWMKAKTCLESAMNDMFVRSDVELMHMCGAEGIHYAASTGVCAVITNEHLAVGHLGDSRVCLLTQGAGEGGERPTNISGEFLTLDHKPDQIPERRRIERSGGSVEYLHNHNNKPFIRGGDFTVRKVMKEQPMQLQYSRAFGGKDLKMYGLSNTPDVTVLPIEDSFRAVLLASDGLWDVYSAQEAAVIAQTAKISGESPAEALVQAALVEQENRRVSSDNVTVICVYFMDN